MTVDYSKSNRFSLAGNRAKILEAHAQADWHRRAHDDLVARSSQPKRN